MKQPTDPNYKPQKSYPSGNEGRRHPKLKHEGYYGRKNGRDTRTDGSEEAPERGA